MDSTMLFWEGLEGGGMESMLKKSNVLDTLHVGVFWFHCLFVCG